MSGQTGPAPCAPQNNSSSDSPLRTRHGAPGASRAISPGSANPLGRRPDTDRPRPRKHPSRLGYLRRAAVRRGGKTCVPVGELVIEHGGDGPAEPVRRGRSEEVQEHGLRTQLLTGGDPRQVLEGAAHLPSQNPDQLWRTHRATAGPARGRPPRSPATRTAPRRAIPRRSGHPGAANGRAGQPRRPVARRSRPTRWPPRSGPAGGRSRSARNLHPFELGAVPEPSVYSIQSRWDNAEW